MSYAPDLRDAGDAGSPNHHKELALRMMRDRKDLAGKLLTDDTWDAQVVEALKPDPGDRVIRKTRYSGFCRTDLEETLQSDNIRYLLLTGIATNVCVESTARDAFFSEFWPILIEDAMNHSGPDFTRQATLWNFEHVFGWLTDARSVVAAIEVSERAGQTVADRAQPSNAAPMV
jgi:ureidoacrylate peracid hydrolase